MREEVLELLVELRGQNLVVRHDQRRPLQRLDHLAHGERLARAGDAQQHLVLFALHHAAHQLLDGLTLVPARLVVDAQAEAHASSLEGAPEIVPNSYPRRDPAPR